jgi:hypothetical protein
MEELASFQALLSTHQPFTPREPLIFRGAVSVWDAVPYAFPDKAFFADSALQVNLQQGINTGDASAHSEATGRGEAPTPLASADRHLLPPVDMRVVDRQQGRARRELVNVAVQCEITGNAAGANQQEPSEEAARSASPRQSASAREGHAKADEDRAEGGATDEHKSGAKVGGLAQGKEAATAREELIEEAKQRTDEHTVEAPAAAKGGHKKRESKKRDAQLPSATRQQAGRRAKGQQHLVAEEK